MAVLEFLSDEYNIFVAMIVVSITYPFFIQFGIFLVPGMMSDLLLEHGHLGIMLRDSGSYLYLLFYLTSYDSALAVGGRAEGDVSLLPVVGRFSGFPLFFH